MWILTPSSSDAAIDSGAPRSAMRNFRSIVVGKIFSALSIWLALAALTKMSDPATVGLYALAQAICIPIAEISKTSLREILSSDIGGTLRFGDYMGMRIVGTLVGFGAMVATGMIQSETAAMLAVIVLYALARSAELVSDMIHGLFQAHERMEHIGWSLCILGPLALGALVVGYWLTGSLAVAVLGQFLAQVAVLAVYDIPHGRRRAAIRRDSLVPRFRMGALGDLARRALPLTFASVLIVVALYFPRLAVEDSLGLGGLGLFAAILALAMAPDRLVNALGVAASVRLAVHYASGRIGEFLRLLSRMLAGVAIAGAAALGLCLVAGEDILRVVYTEDYAAEHRLLLWLVGASALRSLANVLRYGVIATRRFWWLGLKNGAAALVAVTGSVLLIPAFGLEGAGLTMVLVFAVQLAIACAALFVALRHPTGRTGA